MVKKLESVMSPNKKRLIEALQGNKIKRVSELLSKDCDPNSCLADPDQTPLLLYAIKNGMTDCAQELIVHGADVNVHGEKGMTPFLFAAYVGDMNMLKHLIEKDGDVVEACDEDGATGLILAARCNKLECLQFLINIMQPYGIINKQDVGGWTALMYAARNGNKGCVRRLVDAEAHLDIVDSKGYSALMHALWGREYECAMILLNKKANVNIISNNNETAISIALQPLVLGDQEVQKVIIELLWRGADMTSTPNMHTFLHEMIARDLKRFVQLMVMNGCTSMLTTCKQGCFKFKFQREISPIATALLSGYPETAMYLIINNYVMSHDLASLSNDPELTTEISRSGGENTMNALPYIKQMISEQKGIKTQGRESWKKLCVSQWHYLCQDPLCWKDAELNSCNCPDCRKHQDLGHIRGLSISRMFTNIEH